MDAIDVIRAKRDGAELSADQIRWVIDAYTRGAVPDEQMSALLMAVFFRGMSPDELAVWTQAMIDSGERKDLSSLGRPTADKHSTGGVGDKITLPLAPLVAACGVAVPQLSGRGLGHTGGTLDKLESIPGWRADVHEDAYLRQLREVGAVICAAGNDLAPADKKLYSLRDVTGTVESIPLIASSIMSKKIAEGADALVLDVKTGSGAFMRDADDARTLARTMVGLGEAAGVKTVALVTAMDRPLGRAAGNAVEVAESVEVLAGGGPADVVELTLALAREMLAGAGRGDVDPAEALADGRAMDVWRRMIAAQGGDPDAPLPKPAETHVVTAPATGTLTRLDAFSLAWPRGGWAPGGPARRTRCRPRPASSGGPGVGEQVTAGQPLLELQTDDASRIPRALEALEGAFGVDTDDQPLPLILDRIRGHCTLRPAIMERCTTTPRLRAWCRVGPLRMIAGGQRGHCLLVTSTSAVPAVRDWPQPGDPLDPGRRSPSVGWSSATGSSSPSTGWTSTSAAARSSRCSAPTARARRRRSRSARATAGPTPVRSGCSARTRRTVPGRGRRSWASCCSPVPGTAS